LQGNARRPRLAVVSTHPIQYYAPWFRILAADPRIDLRVFYLLEPGAHGLYDPFFGQDVKWDVPLLDGYAHEFVPNVSALPQLGRFWGFRNPELPRRLQDFNSDAILLIGYKYWSMLRLIATWHRGRVPLLFRGDSHRLVPDTSLFAAVKRQIIASIFRRFAAILYVGEANRRYFTHHGVRDQALFRAPHAVDNARFMRSRDTAAAEGRDLRRSLGIAEDDFVFLFAGKFEAKKRPLDLLEAFARAAVPGTVLLFAGAGPLDAELRARAAAMSNVRVIPFQNQSQMPRTYAACDMLVLPSEGPFETWGLAVNEAMCLGKPAIVSTHVGCAEDLVRPGETGLVFEAGNVDSLTEALRAAIAARHRVAAWGEAACRRVADFSYENAARGLIEALDYATGARRALPAAQAR
jgi:glycosyltransferase involved in cell wall biosynthesis